MSPLCLYHWCSYRVNDIHSVRLIPPGFSSCHVPPCSTGVPGVPHGAPQDSCGLWASRLSLPSLLRALMEWRTIKADRQAGRPRWSVSYLLVHTSSVSPYLSLQLWRGQHEASSWLLPAQLWKTILCCLITYLPTVCCKPQAEAMSSMASECQGVLEGAQGRAVLTV